MPSAPARRPEHRAPTPAVSPSIVSPTPGWPDGDAIPPELAGKWYQGDETLIFSGYTYSFPTASGAGGNVVVNGSEIIFFNRSTCGSRLPDGIAHYSWTLSGESVTFVALAPDPCARVARTYFRTKP